MSSNKKAILSMCTFTIFKIECDDDLPKTRGKYYVYRNGEFCGEFYYFNAQYRKNQMMEFSHWCEIPKPKKSLNNENTFFKKIKNKMVLMREKTQS